MLTPTPGNSQIIVKINTVPESEETENKWHRFYLEADNRLFSVTVKPKIFQKLNIHGFENWIAAISGNLGEETDGVIEILNPSIQVFEKKAKAIDEDKAKSKTTKPEPLFSPAHPHAVVATEAISGQVVINLGQALKRYGEKLPEFKFSPIVGGFVCTAKSNKAGATATVATSKKKAKNLAAKLLLDQLHEKTKARERPEAKMPKAEPKVSQKRKTSLEQPKNSQNSNAKLVPQIIEQSPEATQTILRKAKFAISADSITIFCTNQAERLLIMKYNDEVKDVAMSILGKKIKMQIMESQLEKTL